MSNFTNPLDNIRIASPCPANWDEMFGSERKRFCGECKLNVYNLSGMTRQEAENLLVNSEGRLCVRYFRRADGTVLTKNCPVGWAAARQRVSRMAAAAFSVVAGFLTGVFGFNFLREEPKVSVMGAIVSVEKDQLPGETQIEYMGDVDEIRGRVEVVGMRESPKVVKTRGR